MKKWAITVGVVLATMAVVSRVAMADKLVNNK